MFSFVSGIGLRPLVVSSQPWDRGSGTEIWGFVACIQILSWNDRFFPLNNKHYDHWFGSSFCLCFWFSVFLSFFSCRLTFLLITISLFLSKSEKIWTVIGSATEGSLRSPILKDRYDQKIANFIFRWFGRLGGRLVWPVNMLKCT